MGLRSFFCAIALCAASACGEIPQVGQPLTDEERAAAFPQLLPLSSILQSPTAPLISQTDIDNLDMRIAALRARAAKLTAPVIDAPTRAQMRQAVARAALQ